MFLSEMFLKKIKRIREKQIDDVTNNERHFAMFFETENIFY